MTTPIPQPPGVPLLGNIFDVDPNNTWVSLKKLADKYGEIFKITALGQQIVFVCSVALLEEICDEKRFRKCVTGPVVEIRHSVNDALFTAYDNEPIWGISHRIMAPLLTPSAIQTSFNGIRDSAAKLVAKWNSSRAPVNLTDDLRRLNIQTAILCLFGQDQDCLTGAEPNIIPAMERATFEAVKRPTRPKLLNKLIYQRQFDKDTKTMRDFAASIVSKRNSESNPPENDMLHALLHTPDPQTGTKLTSSQVIDEVVTLFIGTVTAPNFIAFALYYLMKNPTCITRARQEIDSVLHKTEELQQHHLARLPYCEAICRESIRLSAPAPGFNIEPIPGTSEPVLLAGGKYQIPPNQCIISILAAVNRDPAIFEEPEAFKPERMLPGEFEKLPLGARRWFGNGKRECIGKNFAWQWSFITLVQILRGTDFVLNDEKYVLKMDGAFSVKPLGLVAKTKTRA